MKKLIKILPILMTITMLFTTIQVLATNVGGYIVDPNTSPRGSNEIIDTGNNILGVIRLVGTIIAVGIIMVLGIKYMMGSAEEKAEYKKTFIPYVIGAVLLFAGVQIATAVIDLAKGMGTA